ncbi:MAG: hypothetical protein AAB350_02480 [Patescibacteria group bacterium]
MAPNFQSSFIPKESVTEEVFKKKKAGMFGVLVVSLFIFSIILSIGMFVYKGIIKSDIQNLQNQLVEEEKNIDKETISEISQFSKKLSMAKSIVFKHKVVSNFLKTLASSTVSSVRFVDFGYDNMKENDLAITLKGKAVDYASIALQENIFSKVNYFKSVTFSNLSLGEGGLVSFDLKISVDPKISVYLP